MKACKDCGAIPKVERVKGDIASGYLRYACPRCGKKTSCVKDDYGHYPGGTIGASQLIADEWNQIN